MSQDEVNRLVNDVMSDSAIQAEAMTVQDQAAMEAFITAKGYNLTKAEIADVWTMAAKVIAAHAEPMDAAKARINEVKSKVQK